MFPHRDVHKFATYVSPSITTQITNKKLKSRVLSIKSVFVRKFTSTSPEGKTGNEIDRILMDSTWHSRVYLMSSLLGEPTVILTIIWWWQKLGTDGWCVNKNAQNSDGEVQIQEIKGGRE
jgi:hypothetical protein